MSHLNAVQNWLHSILGPYRYRHEVYVDVDRTLQSTPSLSPKTDTYTYDDGRTVLLLTIQGTLPITFRGATYNIPVALWIPHDYPTEPPIAYVVPTTAMLVRPSSNVDISGLCRPDYLQMWARKPEGCSLLALTETLQAIFSREPPLYGKPPSTPQPQSSQPPPSQRRPQSHMRPPPAPPGASSSQPAHEPPPPPRPPHPSSRQSPHPGSSQTPYLPAKPQLHVHPSSSSSSPAFASSQPQSPVDGTQRYTQHPPIPDAFGQKRQASQHPPFSPHRRSPSMPFAQPSPTERHDMHRDPSLGNHTQSQSQYNAHAQASPSAHDSLARQPSGHRQSQSYSAPQRHPYSQGQSNGQLHAQGPGATTSPAPTPSPYVPPRPESLRSAAQPPPRSGFRTPVNILDDDDDTASPGGASGAPAPPRPTNPELLNLRRALHAQLSHHLAALHAHLQAENAQLHALHEDLLKGEPAILDEMARLEAVRDVCASARDRMAEVVQRGERNIDELRNRPDPEVDELVCGTNVVHNQLLELVAEDNALEDTIYHLGQAFNSDARTQDELEKFLKRTRALGREQFMKRALINKILLELALSRAQR